MTREDVIQSAREITTSVADAYRDEMQRAYGRGDMIRCADLDRQMRHDLDLALVPHHKLLNLLPPGPIVISAIQPLTD